MAARWRAGEESLLNGNLDFLPLEILDQSSVLSSGDTLEVLQSCLDSSILSMFEDAPTVETKVFDEENEATLLTALTDILDNVEDENLSPFDSLPDSDLLSNKKGKEFSPLRRTICRSSSSQEKDLIRCGRPTSTGKNLPKTQAHFLQRSDGEEEEDSTPPLNPIWQSSFPGHNQLDWEGISPPLSVMLEQEGKDGLSVSLGDFAKHMHPYCMAIRVENEHGEQVLPEGGILLEVVDQGENGEPILAIPNMDLSMAVPFEDLLSENEQKNSDDATVDSDCSEHIIVVDDEDDTTADKTLMTPGSSSDLKDEIVLKRQNKKSKAKRLSRRKKKKKCKQEKHIGSKEGMLLRSGALRKTEENNSVSTAEVTRDSATTPRLLLTERKTQQPEFNEKISCLPSAHDAVPLSTPHGEVHSICTTAAVAGRPAVTQAEGASATAPNAEVSKIPFPVSMGAAVPETKPKSLSLAEYRRLRQQKKPAAVAKQDDNSTKWPSLPEPPKELPPIPCLPNPNPNQKDPRRSNPQAPKKDDEDVRPAWQPKGSGAPPTPEALLAPPAYMISSSSRVAAARNAKPQQTPESSLQPPVTATNSCSNVNTHHDITVRPAEPSPPTSNVPAVDGDSSSAAVMGSKDLISGLPQSKSVSPEPAQLSNISSRTTADAPSCSPTSPDKLISQELPEVAGSTSLNNVIANVSKSLKLAVSDRQSHPARVAALSLGSHGAALRPGMLEIEDESTTVKKSLCEKSATQKLIEAFTTEIGIEASDLTSLLEQFEETQAKEKRCVPEVSGRAAAVGNSSRQSVPKKTVVERMRVNDLSSAAVLTPPATPPHLMWKPLVPVTLLGLMGRKKPPDSSKSSPAKIIQIEAQPLPLVRSRSKPTVAPTAVAPHLVYMDHDYCLLSKDASTGEAKKCLNVKPQSFITTIPTKPQAPDTTPKNSTATNRTATSKTEDCLNQFPKKTAEPVESSVLDTPGASPSQLEPVSNFKVENPRGRPQRRRYRRRASSQSQSPKGCTDDRIGARPRKRRSQRSPSSTSSSSDSHSSRSRSPEKKSRYRPRNLSSSSSRSSSRSSSSRSPPRRRRHSYSSSHSGSWSRSRSRSPQRPEQWGKSSRMYSPSPGHGPKIKMEAMKRRKDKAIEERRIVYVGRIRGTMTQKELRERFSLFGDIEECTLHFRDKGDNYGFVTYYDTKDAFMAIENGSKLRKPDELPFDLCFGGRRQFCQTSYSDLDSSREYDSLPSRGKFHSLDFDSLLKQAQQNLKR